MSIIFLKISNKDHIIILIPDQTLISYICQETYLIDVYRWSAAVLIVFLSKFNSDIVLVIYKIK